MLTSLKALYVACGKLYAYKFCHKYTCIHTVAIASCVNASKLIDLLSHTSSLIKAFITHSVITRCQNRIIHQLITKWTNILLPL